MTNHNQQQTFAFQNTWLWKPGHESRRKSFFWSRFWSVRLNPSRKERLIAKWPRSSGNIYLATVTVDWKGTLTLDAQKT
jgi:hypothetical protein